MEQNETKIQDSAQNIFQVQRSTWDTTEIYYHYLDTLYILLGRGRGAEEKLHKDFEFYLLDV